MDGQDDINRKQKNKSLKRNETTQKRMKNVDLKQETKSDAVNSVIVQLKEIKKRID